MNDEVESRKVFGPSSLVVCENIGRGEVLKVSMVSNDIDRGTGTFEVMSSSLKSFIDSTQLLVMNIIVVFHGLKGLGMKSNQVQLA